MKRNHFGPLFTNLVLIIILTNLVGIGDCQYIRLPQLNVKRDQITLSGFSSGAGMAQQLQFSYSSFFSGIAIFSQTYYRCGPGNGILTTFDRLCTLLGNATREELYDPKKAMADIQGYARRNLIENPENLKYTKLYVYAGLNNALFTAEMILNTVRIYEQYITNPTNIKTRVQDASLILPSASFGSPCREDPERSFYINNCGLSGPLEALQFLLGPEIVKPSRMRALQPLLTFDQTEFFGQDVHYVNDYGFLYIPTGCQGILHGPPQAPCYLHFYFHGCYTGVDFVGPDHILNSGFIEIAEANNIIVVFPQNLRSDEPELGDIGCWDTYGFTGRLYATQRGTQVRIMKRMLDRILGLEEDPAPHNPFGMMGQHNFEKFFLNETTSRLQIIPPVSFRY